MIVCLRRRFSRRWCDFPNVILCCKCLDPPRFQAMQEMSRFATLSNRWAAARHRRQGHGVVARRGRGARFDRAHADPVPALADGKGRDAGRASAGGLGGAHLGIAERRRRVFDGARWILQFAAPLRARRQGHPARHRAEEIGHNKATEVAWSADGLGHGSTRRQALAKRSPPTTRGPGN